MKKIICLFFSALTLFLSATVAHGAAGEEPVIFVPGYTSSRMWIYRGTEQEKRIWKVDVADEILDAVKQEIPKIAASALPATVGYYDELFQALEPYAKEITEYLRINDDSTSLYDVEVYPHSVETTRLDKLDAYGYRPDHDTLSMLKKYTSPKNIYCCTLDWRLGQVDNAAVLNAYVDDVLQATGAEKVNIIGVSYGGQVTASYLSLYGGKKVHRVVLHSPALDGSSIVPQLFSGEKLNIAWSDLLRLVQAFRKEETDFSQLTDVVSVDFLNGFAGAFIQYYLYDLFLNFGSAWDLVPLAQYPALRDRLLADGKHTLLIEKSDKYHFEIAANRKADFARLQKEGVQISVIAGYGSALAVDNGLNSDGVIEVASCTGAACAALGKKLFDTQRDISCKNSVHCHIDPCEVINAATAYLPENTWFVADMFHGLGTNEDKISRLMCTLLFTDNIADVHSSPDYPQFLSSENAFCGVFSRFSACKEGFLTPYSAQLTVQNLSKTESISVADITCSEKNLHFAFDRSQMLAPGESITAQVWGKLPQDLACLTVRVLYVTHKENASIAESRTQSFRYTNNALLAQALTQQVDETTPRIEQTDLQCQGKLSFTTLLSLLGYYIKLFLTRSLSLFRF